MIRRSRPMAALVGLLLVWGAATAGPAQADPEAPPSTWQSLTGVDGWVRAWAHSVPSTTVFAGLDRGGVRRSVDGGETWSTFSEGLPAGVRVRALWTDVRGKTTFAGTSAGLYRSREGGRWHPLAVTAPIHSLERLGGQLFAGTAGAGVWRSRNGTAWTSQRGGGGIPLGDTVTGLSRSVSGQTFATSTSGVYVSGYRGASWRRVSDGIPADARPTQTRSWFAHPHELFTSTERRGVYRSWDGGKSWVPTAGGLPARVHDLQVLESSETLDLYATTDRGLWHAQQVADGPEPTWSKVTTAGLSDPRLWGLTFPSVSRSGTPDLLVGSQTGGAALLAFEPPDSVCQGPADSSANCPRLSDSTPTVGQRLLASAGAWTGTGPISVDFQWERCTQPSSSTCSPIAGARESSYVVPPSALDATPHLAYRVVVRGRNGMHGSSAAISKSTVSAATVDNTGPYPGAEEVHQPSIRVLPAGQTTAPVVGDTMYADFGTAPDSASDGFFAPAATTLAYQWLRCDSDGEACTLMPGATGRSHVLDAADATATLRVRVTGTNDSGVRELLSGPSYAVGRAPAAPLPGQRPQVLGSPWVGRWVAGSVGAWADPPTQWSRRWLRCDQAGARCRALPVTDATYAIKAADLGHTLRLRVTADVGADLGNGGPDVAPRSTTLVSPATRVVVRAPDRVRPVVTELRAVSPTFVAGSGRGFRLVSSEPGEAHLVVRSTSSPKPVARSSMRIRWGQAGVPFRGTVNGRRLDPGRYVATLVVVDAAGNTSLPRRTTFRIRPA